MFEGLASLLKAIKEASIQIFAAIAVTTGFLLLAPDSFITTIGLSEILTRYRSYLGIALLSSIVIMVVRLVGWLYKRTNLHISQKHQEKLLIQSLSELTPGEKAYLLPYIADKRNTQYFLIEDGIASGLVAKNILYLASNLGHPDFAYNMQPWARRHLAKNVNLLQGASKSELPPRQRIETDWDNV